MTHFRSFSAFVTIILLMISPAINAQKQSFIGVTGTLDRIDYDFRLGGGLTFECQFSAHWGLQTGLYYRSQLTEIHSETYVYDNSVPVYTGNLKSVVRENYLSIPLIAKYYSKIVDFSAGATIDFFTNYDVVEEDVLIDVTSYSISPKVQWGLAAKVSKSFPIGSKFFIEPDLHLNPIINFEKLYWGIGLTGKLNL